MNIGELQFAGNFQRGRGAFNPGMRADGSMHADIVALDQSRNLAEIAGIERDVGFQPVGCGAAWIQIPARGAAQMAKSVAGAIGARGPAGKLNVELAGTIWIDAQIGI